MANLLPEGTYQGEILEWEVKESSKNKTPYIEFAVLVTHAEGVEMEAPRRRLVPVWISTKALEGAFRTFSALGFKGRDMSRLDPLSPDKHDFAGKRVELKVEHEIYTRRDGKEIPQEKAQFAFAQPALVADRKKEVFTNLGDAWNSLVTRETGEEPPEPWAETADPVGAEYAEAD